MLRALVMPCFILGVAALATLVFGPHSFMPNAPGLQAAAHTCADAGGERVSGLLPVGGKSTPSVVQIVPVEPYGAEYLNIVRLKLGLPPRAGAAFSATDLAQFSHVVRYAPIDRHGRFTCSALEPGRYFAVVTTPQPYGRLEVNVASFDLKPDRGATVPTGRFRPLQQIQ